MTRLPGGTVYPALRRLERDDLIRSQWEKQSIAKSSSSPGQYAGLERTHKLLVYVLFEEFAEIVLVPG
jgi:hypothetical protein